jgi:hypothetical protein
MHVHTYKKNHFFPRPFHFFFIVYLMFVVQEECEEGKPIGGEVGD